MFTLFLMIRPSLQDSLNFDGSDPFVFVVHADADSDTIDVTELKLYLHRANMHRTNPTLFKKINDVARESDFTARWTLPQMQSFLTAGGGFLETPT